MAGLSLLCWLLLLIIQTDDRCYKCNEIDKPYVPCPGWHRRPVDTYLDLKDRGGLYTHCLEIRLANGTVIRQDAVPEKPSCESRFRLEMLANHDSAGVGDSVIIRVNCRAVPITLK